MVEVAKPTTVVKAVQAVPVAVAQDREVVVATVVALDLIQAAALAQALQVAAVVQIQAAEAALVTVKTVQQAAVAALVLLL